MTDRGAVEQIQHRQAVYSGDFLNGINIGTQRLLGRFGAISVGIGFCTARCWSNNNDRYVGIFCAQPFVKRVAGTAECIGRKISDFSEWRKAVAKIICSAENNYCVSMVIHLMKAPAKIQVVAGVVRSLHLVGDACSANAIVACMGQTIVAAQNFYIAFVWGRCPCAFGDTIS